MRTASDVAKYVVYSYWKQGRVITNLKLQKILYYIQGYSFKRCNEAAYLEDIYRWPYGPVVPDVYYEYNHFRAEPIAEPSDATMLAALKNLRKKDAILSVIDDVVRFSYAHTAADLVEKTHNETPWVTTKDAEIITPMLIAAYFSTHDPLGIERKEYDENR